MHASLSLPTISVQGSKYLYVPIRAFACDIFACWHAHRPRLVTTLTDAETQFSTDYLKAVFSSKLQSRILPFLSGGGSQKERTSTRGKVTSCTT